LPTSGAIEIEKQEDFGSHLFRAEMSAEKKALKVLEIPLNRFNESAVPYHLEVLSKHRTNIQKVNNQ